MQYEKRPLGNMEACLCHGQQLSWLPCSKNKVGWLIMYRHCLSWTWISCVLQIILKFSSLPTCGDLPSTSSWDYEVLLRPLEKCCFPSDWNPDSDSNSIVAVAGPSYTQPKQNFSYEVQRVEPPSDATLFIVLVSTRLFKFMHHINVLQIQI